MSVNLKMAWRNLWRNPRRTLLTIAAIAFACLLLVFMLSWQFGSYEAMINAAVKIHTGHLQVQAKGYQEKRSIRQVITDPKAVAEPAAKNARGEAFHLSGQCLFPYLLQAAHLRRPGGGHRPGAGGAGLHPQEDHPQREIP